MPRYRTGATKSPPRIMIEVTPRQFDTFKRYLPYGFQKQIFSAIIEDMCQMWEEFGDEFTRAMITKNLTYKQFMTDHIRRNYGNTRGPQEASLPIHDLGGTTRAYKEYQSTQEGEENAESPC